MISVTMGELLSAEPVLKRLVEVRLPAGHSKLVYDVSRMLRLVSVETNHFETQRTTHIKELGKEREPTPQETANGVQGSVTSVTPEHWPEFVRRVEDMTTISIELDAQPLDLSRLDVYELSGADMMGLGPLVVAPQE